jgi:hypothetical protein
MFLPHWPGFLRALEVLTWTHKCSSLPPPIHFVLQCIGSSPTKVQGCHFALRWMPKVEQMHGSSMGFPLTYPATVHPCWHLSAQQLWADKEFSPSLCGRGSQ